MPDLAQTYPTMYFRDKIRATLGMALSAAVFLTLGWPMLAPFDPFGAIVLFTDGNPLITTVGVFILAIAVGAASYAIAGTKLPDFALFAVGLGLAVVNLKAGTMDYLLITQGGSVPAARGSLCFRLIAELWAWTILVALAAAFAAWGLGRLRGTSPPDGDAPAAGPCTTTLDDVFARLLAGKIRSAATGQEIRDGLASTAASVVVACIIISLAMAASPVDAVQKGQVYFAIGAAFYLGTIASHQFFHPGWCVWSYLAVPVTATIGYALAWFRPDLSGLPRTLLSAAAEYNHLPMMPSNAFVRGTPLDYVAVGLAAAVAGCWLTRKTHRLRSGDES